MVARTPRRLPGFRFEIQSPPLTDILPRMDVAAFVGFAASGPLHRPVAVEDAAQFTSIFGADVPLAWDRRRSEVVYAYLAPSVRAFFRNGGQRCWVVRVASENARYNYFPLPGLVQVNASGQLMPAFARARSEGSWSDSWQVSTALLSLSISPAQVSLADLSVELALASPGDIVAGDLLRLTFYDEGYVLLFVVQSVQPIDAQEGGSPPQHSAGQSLVRVTGSPGTATWLSTRLTASPPPAAKQAVTFTHEGEGLVFPVGSYTIFQEGGNQVIDLELPGLSLANAPALGSLIRIDFHAVPSLFLSVQDVSISRDGSPPADTLQVTGQGQWALRSAPQPLPASSPLLERLTFELWARQENGYPVRLGDLGFAEARPRFWGALPTDEQLFYATDAAGSISPASLWQAADDPVHADLWQEVAAPRFPLAGTGATGAPGQVAFYIPLAMPFVPEQYLSADIPPDTLLDTALRRDGLDNFSADLFLDCDLAEPLTPDILAQADFLRYQGPSPRFLRGIHALLGVGEATIIAVPDAVHRGWSPAIPGEALPPQDSPPLIRPEWWHFLNCDPPPALPAVQAPLWGNFLSSDIKAVPPPVLCTMEPPDERGTFTLGWSTWSEPRAISILEESTSPAFSGSVVVSTGQFDRMTLYGRSPGDYYYRVRTVADGNSSDWSNGVVVRVAPANRWLLNDITNYTANTLLAVQRALLRLCAARGDMCAVLSLPEHYHEDDAITHVAKLTDPRLRSAIQVCGVDGGARFVYPLGTGETRASSYGALYHPWPIGLEENQAVGLRLVPPEGAIAGLWAQRAITHGAWIAPANELLNGVVALTPPVARERWLDLQEAQVNLIRQGPRGFFSLSADTLSGDEDADVRPINVRRLLILLRRLALRLGAGYMFEPNSPAFRRSVQRGFEDMLDRLFVRGAFAGSTPDASYQVVTDSALNTPGSVEQGRFIVDLRVAPSLPLTFLTLRLVQAGASAAITEGG